VNFQLKKRRHSADFPEGSCRVLRKYYSIHGAEKSNFCGYGTKMSFLSRKYLWAIVVACDKAGEVMSSSLNLYRWFSF